MKNSGEVRARTCGTKSPCRSEALRFIDSAKSHLQKISLSVSLSLSLSLSLSVSHQAHLTHNIGRASALPTTAGKDEGVIPPNKQHAGTAHWLAACRQRLKTRKKSCTRPFQRSIEVKKTKCLAIRKLLSDEGRTWLMHLFISTDPIVGPHSDHSASF